LNFAKNRIRAAPNKPAFNDPQLPHISSFPTQLIDSLTSHISLYHSHTNSHGPSPNPNPTRSAILKWFSSLTVHQRQAHLTAVDSKFVQILIQMLRKLRTHGHGRSSPSPTSPHVISLPSASGSHVVAESDESNRLIFDSTRLFSSAEGEDVPACSCSIESVDAVTVSEELVEDLERFVGAMDAISNGGLLERRRERVGIGLGGIGVVEGERVLQLRGVCGESVGSGAEAGVVEL
jgi:hypothetical protein